MGKFRSKGWVATHHGGALLEMFEALTPFPLDWDYFAFSRLSLIMEVNCEEALCRGCTHKCATKSNAGSLCVLKGASKPLGERLEPRTTHQRS
ncbi:uncharacterized protein RCC_03388 [Ramularia collo-cygni]|uniref:Uncharacterized protein n=1 Tax=Ramularia collo-cygni TaxID=112498 RepID=A0A2D3V4X4_9PEZI|nr:uncharacterized protein RCC_03388 [Ramularia collo-cygni]CZT17554.1 uncharacterized protein RCC_03388 [Ramularia collo-cygni]